MIRIQTYKARAGLCACLFCVSSLLFCAMASAVDSPAMLLTRAANLRLHPRERDLAGRAFLACPENQVLPLLEKQLHSRTPHLCQTAVILLGRMSSPRAETLLLQIAETPNPLLRASLETALQRYYTLLSDVALLKRMKGTISLPKGCTVSGAGVLRITKATRALAKRYDQEGAPALPETVEVTLLALLENQEELIRAAAADALCVSGSEAVANALLSLLDTETSVSVLRAVCRAVARIRPNDEGDGLLKLLKQNEDPYLSADVTVALHALGFEGGDRALAVLLAHERAGVREAAMRAATRMHDPVMLPLVSKACSDSNWRVRMAAVEVLGSFRTPDAVELLQRLFRDTEPRVRAKAAVTLHRLGAMMGIENALRQDLLGEEPTARAEAATALGAIGAKRAVKALASAGGDANLELACRAMESLGQIGGREATDALLWHLMDPKRPVVSDAARRALGALYEGDPGPDGDWKAWLGKHRLQMPDRS